MSSRTWTTALALAVAAAVAVPLTPAAATTTTGPVVGTVFDDVDRDGLHDAGEPGLREHTLNLVDDDGTPVAVATTGADGRYRFDGLVGGRAYRVEVSGPTWWGIRYEWVPTTTGSMARPSVPAAADGTADIGWRRVVRTVPPAAPVSSLTGPDGLRVESYNDAVSAAEIAAALREGRVGDEAATVLVRFDASASSTTTTAVGATNGRYDSFGATVDVTFESWLDGRDEVLSHEYGHAWSLYYAYLVQQDSTLAGYLAARGLTDDPRVGSGYEWSPRELIAEDYRQLLGSPTAADAPQTNQHLPRAADVPGLLEYLTTTFVGQSSDPSPTPAPGPTPSDSADPTPTASPSPTPTASTTPTPTPTPVATESPTPKKGKSGGGGGCKRC